MDDALYQQWWPLHLRVALGEDLDAEEKTRYEAGLREMEKDEPIPAPSPLREARKALEGLRVDHARLAARGQELDAEIAALEAALNPETRRLLGLED